MARRKSYDIALGGVMAALAIVVMALGTMIPVATFVCPMICTMLLKVVLSRCKDRIAWAWFGAVAILGALLSPDKEAAAVFVALGYYPIIKPKLDALPAMWLWKGIYFNAVILLLYWGLMHVFGMAQVAAEFAEMGMIMTAITLILGNVCFFLLDRLLGIKKRTR